MQIRLQPLTALGQAPLPFQAQLQSSGIAALAHGCRDFFQKSGEFSSGQILIRRVSPLGRKLPDPVLRRDKGIMHPFQPIEEKLIVV
ncbi:hypothetical protein D3C71_2018980 [compost metagenome]